MTQVLCDASIVVKWFLDEAGPETSAARALADHAAEQRVSLRVLDLTYYEVANVLTAKRGVPPGVAAALLDKVHAICGDGLTLGPTPRAHAAEIADRHGLSFSDAAYVAVGRDRGIPVPSADLTMIAAGATPTRELLESLA